MANWPDMYFDPINLWSVWHMNNKDNYETGKLAKGSYTEEEINKVLTGLMTNDPRQGTLYNLKNKQTKKEYITKLVNDHWSYIQGVLVQDGVHPQAIERIEYHYKTAFEHGFKHAEEYHNVNTK